MSINERKKGFIILFVIIGLLVGFMVNRIPWVYITISAFLYYNEFHKKIL